MFESEFPGMQHLSFVLTCWFAAIDFVTRNRMPDVMQMHPNLVSSPAVQGTFHQAHSVAAR